LALGLVTAGVLSVGLAAPASAAGVNSMITSVTSINIANQADALLISGTAESEVTEVVLELLSGTAAGVLVPVELTADDPAAGRSWTASVPGADIPDGQTDFVASFTNCVVDCFAISSVQKDTQSLAPAGFPDSGTYAVAQSVEITADDPADTTRYTTDGTTPTSVTDGLLVSGLIAVSTTQTIRAVSFDAAGNVSPPLVLDYIISAAPAPAATPTTTALTVSPTSPRVFGTAVTLTASVAPVSGTATPVGTFEFFDFFNGLTTSLGANGNVTPAVGTHSYTAKFIPANAANFTTSTSSATSYTINAAPITATATTTALTVSPTSPRVFGTAVTLSATVSPTTAVGTFQFSDNLAPLDGPGAATKTVTPAVGTHSYTVTFIPAFAADFTTSASTAISFTVNAVVVTPPGDGGGGGTPGGGTPPIVVTPPATPVVTAPKVMSRTPGVNATGVTRTGNITAKFSKSVTGVNARSFTLRTKAGAAVAAAVSYNSASRMATLNPTRTLLADTTYVATLSSAITAGKALAVTRWSFTTGARPSIIARTPAANTRNVARAANVTVRFSEKVTGVSGSSLMLMTPSGRRVAAVVSYNRFTRMATLNPSSRLAAGTKYTVLVGSAIKDAAGNRFAATRWSFTTTR